MARCIYLLLSFVGVFMIGAYAERTVFGNGEIRTYQWGITSFFAIYFLIAFFKETGKSK